MVMQPMDATLCSEIIHLVNGRSINRFLRPEKLLKESLVPG